MADENDTLLVVLEDASEPDPDPSPAVADPPMPPVLIDWKPAAAPAHAVAPLTALAKGHAMLLLHPGLNPVSGPLWSAYAGHPGIAPLLEAKELAELDGVPRRSQVLSQLIERTWSPAGLDLIERVDAARNGGEPRRFVAELLEHQRARIAKRTK